MNFVYNEVPDWPSKMRSVFEENGGRVELKFVWCSNVFSKSKRNGVLFQCDVIKMIEIRNKDII